MPSFDIVSKVDAQALENAVNVVSKEITNRFDFKGSHVVINLDKKEYKLKIETDNAAFQDVQEEVARILREVAVNLEIGIKKANVRDINGNVVGEFNLTL